MALFHMSTQFNILLQCLYAFPSLLFGKNPLTADHESLYSLPSIYQKQKCIRYSRIKLFVFKPKTTKKLTCKVSIRQTRLKYQSINCIQGQIPTVCLHCKYRSRALKSRGSQLKSGLFLQRSQYIDLNFDVIKVFQIRLLTQLRLLIQSGS